MEVKNKVKEFVIKIKEHVGIPLKQSGAGSGGIGYTQERSIFVKGKTLGEAFDKFQKKQHYGYILVDVTQVK